MRAIARFAVLAALAGCTTQPPLPAAPADLVAAVNARGANECNDNVARVLAAHGIGAAQLTGVRYTESFAVRGRGDSFINGQTAWVSLQGQSGTGVIHLDSDCSLRGVSGFPR